LLSLRQKKKAAEKRLEQRSKKSTRIRMCYCRRTYTDAIGHSRKGLLVLDVKVKGTPSHAHHNEDNAILQNNSRDGMVQNYSYEKISEQLGRK
jgi:hypothetical protein